MPEMLKDRIIENSKLAPGIFRMVLESEYVAGTAKPGQFVNIRCGEDLSALLRRPVSICTVDRCNNTYEIVYQVKGRGTALLAEKQPGSRLDVLGPLGNSFDTDVKYGRIAVVGGGIGIFPLLFVLKESPSEIKHSYLGFRNSECVVLEREFESRSNSLDISTDDGTYGCKGLVTEILERDIQNTRFDMIYACGPTPMLRQTAILSERYGIPCQVSLEQRMGCGFGACLVCACKTGKPESWEFSHVCKDGPVFWSREVLFD